MSTGTSLLLLALGAILKYAVSDRIAGVNLQNAGVILMVVGVVGLVVTLILVSSHGRLIRR